MRSPRRISWVSISDRLNWLSRVRIEVLRSSAGAWPGMKHRQWFVATPQPAPILQIIRNWKKPAVASAS